MTANLIVAWADEWKCVIAPDQIELYALTTAPREVLTAANLTITESEKVIPAHTIRALWVSPIIVCSISVSTLTKRWQWMPSLGSSTMTMLESCRRTPPGPFQAA